MTWLIDKSALVRLGKGIDTHMWANRIERGLVTISTVTKLEVGFSATSGVDHRRAMRSTLLASMPVDYLTPAIEDRALAVQALLAERGHHRAPSVPDLLIAATAELSGRTVLHHDKDFDLIVAVTAQTMERLQV